jgi:hypothetical protein
MGERRNDGGPDGRRRVHPEGALPGHREAARSGRGGGPVPGRRVVDAAGLEALLAAALIRDVVDPGAEQRAVAAFRAAREAGAHGARTRRRDDWRPRRRPFGGHSLKATLSVLLAGLTLGGVAVAGIGAAGPAEDGSAEDGRGTHAPPSPSALSGPSAGPSAGQSAGPGSGPAASDRPAEAGDTEAHCRAYARVEGRRNALDATAWKRLQQAAGGAAKVGAYCAEQLERAGARTRHDGAPAPQANTGGTGNSSSGNADGNATGDAGNGGSGNGGSGNGAGGSGGSGQADSGSGGAGSGSGAAAGGSGGSRGRAAQQGAGNP